MKASLPLLRQLVRSACANLAHRRVFDLFGLLLNKTTFGRNTLAIGGTKRLRVWRVYRLFAPKLLSFSLWPGISDSRNYSGFTYDQWQPMTSIGYELIVISACVLGAFL